MVTWRGERRTLPELSDEVEASFDGDDLVLVLEDPDNLPGVISWRTSKGVVPAGTNVVVNHVSGERYLLGTVA